MPSLSAAETVDAGARLLARPLRLVRVLTGGQHAVTVLATDGSDSYVVRAFPKDDPAVGHEITVLEKLRPLGTLTPTLVTHGEVSRHPVIVTTALPGSHPAPDLPLTTMAEQLATALAMIHRLDGTGLREEPSEPAVRDDPLGARARAVWPQLDLGTRVLTHFDFWSGNALWDNDLLVGVVDWSPARSAPRGVDVA